MSLWTAPDPFVSHSPLLCMHYNYNETFNATPPPHKTLQKTATHRHKNKLVPKSPLLCTHYNYNETFNVTPHLTKQYEGKLQHWHKNELVTKSKVGSSMHKKSCPTLVILFKNTAVGTMTKGLAKPAPAAMAHKKLLPKQSVAFRNTCPPVNVSACPRAVNLAPVTNLTATASDQLCMLVYCNWMASTELFFPMYEKVYNSCKHESGQSTKPTCPPQLQLLPALMKPACLCWANLALLPTPERLCIDNTTTNKTKHKNVQTFWYHLRTKISTIIEHSRLQSKQYRRLKI